MPETTIFSTQEKVNISTSTCYHCGEECQEELITFEEHSFCCEGCKMVYDLLNTNDLCDFYNIEQRAGISLRQQQKARYAWLDEEEVVQQLINFQNDRITKVSFYIPQIHCASCLWLLEHLYKLNAAVNQSRVHFLKKEVYITFNHQQTSLRNIVELLALIGYAPHIQLDQLDQKKTSVDRKFIYQLGVAGFAFGNIMLLSFPEYLGLSTDLFQSLFGYLNILLIIPVILYSGQHYLKSAWFGLRQGNLNIDVPIALGILTLFGRSIFEILTQTGTGYLDSLAGLILFLLAGRWFQQKTYHHLSFERDYKSYFPISATVFKNGKETSVSLQKLNIGDIILIRNQEVIPVDGQLIKGNAQIDYSFVTGEADPVEVNISEKIYAGGRQTGSAIQILMTKSIDQSYLIQLWNEDTFQKQDASHASTLANKVGKYFTYTILAIAFATLFYWLPKDIALAINAFTAVLIIACPCAVALSIPFTLGNIMRLLAQKGFYLKSTQVIENFHQADAVVFDKTGTLTDTQRFSVDYTGQTLSDEERLFVLKMVQQSNHPLSKAIKQHLTISNQGKKALLDLSDFKEITGKGLIGKINHVNIKIGSPDFVGKPTNITSSGQVYINIDGQILGHFSVRPHYRRGLSSLFNYLKTFANTYLLSGDNDHERFHLQSFFNTDHLFFRQSPKDKLHFIRSLQEKNQTIVMIGDGLNDAGALKQSDIGIVISENTNNFTPACDAILNANKFEQLPTFINIAKGSLKLVYFAYGLAFIYNVIGLSFAVQGLLSPLIAAILMPLSSITIVVFGVLSSYWWVHFQLNNKQEKIFN